MENPVLTNPDLTNSLLNNPSLSNLTFSNPFLADPPVTDTTAQPDIKTFTENTKSIQTFSESDYKPKKGPIISIGFIPESQRYICSDDLPVLPGKVFSLTRNVRASRVSHFRNLGDTSVKIRLKWMSSGSVRSHPNYYTKNY